MAFSTPVSLFWVATVSCLIVNAFELEKLLPLPYSGVDRQSKQMFVMPPAPLYNYYNPFGAPILIPTAQDQIHPELFISGDSQSALMPKIFKTEDISITPAITDCNYMQSPLSKCIKSSTAPSGTLNIQFTSASQNAVVSIAPKQFFYSRVQLTCTEMSPSMRIFMKSVDSSSSSFTSGPFTTTELKPLQMMVTANTATDKLKCSWSSAF